jgi:integrase
VEVIGTSQRSVLVACPPKTINSRRTCPLSALPLKWIKLYSKTNTPDRYIVGLGKKPVEPRTYRNWYYSELERLGLPKLNPHCMRHTFATQMLHSGVDPATIASILGHSSPAVTLEIYSHTDEEEKQKQVNAVFGKLFR